MVTQPPVRTPRAANPWIAYALAWIPFAILEAIANTFENEFRAGVLDVLNVALGRTIVSAIMGVGVWWLSGRIRFPARGRVGFYAGQLGLGVAFSAIWNGIWYTRWALQVGWPKSFADNGGVPGLGWEFMMGVWLYVIIAGISYMSRAHRLLREKEVAAARSEALAARMQLAALRSQLNPHFLFNSLHSLSTLMQHDVATAEEALGRLGDLLRYALDGAESEDVQLSQEWEFTRNYLRLEELRFGNRLRVKTEIDDGALEHDVPSFVLQPLVENAIRHGIAPRPEGGTLTICARRLGDQLVLHVKDDGPGATADRLSNGRGLGLRVLRQRLETRYGNRARVDVLTSPGGGFEVVVCLPMDEAIALEGTTE